jgi:hypothetical protein
MPSTRSPAAHVCLRAGLQLAGYAALVAATGLLFILDARTPAEIHFSETSRIEYAETVLLLLTMLAFACGRGRDAGRRALATLFCGVALTALVRELDWVMDDLAHGLWKAPAAVVVVATGVAAWRSRACLVPAMAELTRRPAWGLLTGGFLTVFVYSRLIGMKANWVAMLGHGAVMSSIKRAAEEGVELLGYTLIACGAWAFLVDRWTLPQEPARPSAPP